MRITRIREFKNSTEVTLVLEGNDGEALCHAFDCCGNCVYPKRQLVGIKLLKLLRFRVFGAAWRSPWKD